MQDRINEIVAREWAFFQAVHNIGGRAACQDNYKTFVIMRKSQFLAWSDELLASYLADLVAAEQAGRNLINEKYARMMERTSPWEYRRLKGFLPDIPPATAALVDEMVALHLEWQRDYARTYPKLAARSRPVGSDDDLSGETSFATYLWGELLSYSPETLALYAAHVKRLQAQGVNMSLLILEHTVKMHGFASLEKAESSLG